MPKGDALALLKEDHDKVKRLFADFEKLGDRAVKTKAELGTEICMELSVHAQIEEQGFYPRVLAMGKELKDEVLEAVEEHDLIKTLVAELEALSPENETYDAKMQVLGEQVQHHVEEEEKEMFSRVRKALDEIALLEIGNELAALKASLKQAWPHFAG